MLATAVACDVVKAHLVPEIDNVRDTVAKDDPATSRCSSDCSRA